MGFSIEQLSSHDLLEGIFRVKVLLQKVPDFLKKVFLKVSLNENIQKTY